MENPSHRPEDWCEPHKWPEVSALARRFTGALGLANPRLALYGRDSGVRALVLLLATFSVEELERAATRASMDDWLRTNSRGLSSLSVEVVRRLIDPRRASARGADGGKRQPDYEGEKTFSAAALFAEQGDETNEEPAA